MVYVPRYDITANAETLYQASRIFPDYLRHGRYISGDEGLFRTRASRDAKEVSHDTIVRSVHRTQLTNSILCP